MYIESYSTCKQLQGKEFRLRKALSYHWRLILMQIMQDQLLIEGLLQDIILFLEGTW